MTPCRRSSVWIQTRSGPGRAAVSASFGPYRARSSASSVSALDRVPGERHRVARLTTEATAPALMPETPGRLPVTPTQRPLQSQNLSNVSHGQSFRGHRTPGTGCRQRRDGRSRCPASPTGDHDAWNR